MILVTVPTLARSTPSIDVESFPSDKPVLADLLRPSRYESECLTSTLVAIVFQLVFYKLLLMVLEKTAAEAP